MNRSSRPSYKKSNFADQEGALFNFEKLLEEEVKELNDAG